MFETDKHDIDFAIFVATDRKAYQKKAWTVVRQRARYNSHLAPESGTQPCAQPGVCQCTQLF